MKYKLVIILMVLAFATTVVYALPTTGAASGVTNNNANFTCTGVTGDTAWMRWGQNPAVPVWQSENFTATAGSADTRVWGAPLSTGTLYYARCCDSTGCSATGQSFTTLTATVITQTTFSAGWTNLTSSHFNVMFIAPAVLKGYTDNIPTTIFFGIIFGFIVVGMWRMNKGTRLVSIVFMMIGGFLMTTNTGLEMGIPGVLQSIGVAALAAGLSGIFLSFIRRG